MLIFFTENFQYLDRCELQNDCSFYNVSVDRILSIFTLLSATLVSVPAVQPVDTLADCKQRHSYTTHLQYTTSNGCWRSSLLAWRTSTLLTLPGLARWSFSTKARDQNKMNQWSNTAHFLNNLYDHSEVLHRVLNSPGMTVFIVQSRTDLFLACPVLEMKGEFGIWLLNFQHTWGKITWFWLKSTQIPFP